MTTPTFDHAVAAYVIASYIADLPKWSDEALEGNAADARKLADDLGIRREAEEELYALGSELAESPDVTKGRA